jgi:hypothetical protein
MGFQVQIRKDGDTIQGCAVRIEYAGGSAEGTTDEGGFVNFDYDKDGSVTIYLDGQRRGTYDYAETQSVTIML